MSDIIFTLDNIRKTPMEGYQQKAIVVSANGYSYGFSDSFDVLIDPGAYHTCISESIMSKILSKVVDKNGNMLMEVGKISAKGVYGEFNRESVYVLPHFYIGDMHLTDVAVAVLKTDNIQCLLGRSILHQCVLTLNPELNHMQFNFKESLKQHKQLVNNVEPFNKIFQFAELL